MEQTKKMFFNGLTNDDYITGASGGGIEMFAGSNAKRLALGSTSYLHGTWVAASGQFTSSDASLKKNIVPLYKSLSKLQQARRIAQSTESELLDSADRLITRDASTDEFVKEYNTTMMSEDTIKAMQMGDNQDKYRSELKDAQALFNELRPVSYVMKEKGQVEAKNLRFGFIAQEVEKILPSLVSTDDQTGTKSLMYNDLIAVVVMTLQQELSLTSDLIQRVDAQDERITTVDERVAALEKEIMALREELVQKKVVEERAQRDIVVTQASGVGSYSDLENQQRRSKEPQIPVGRKQEQAVVEDIPTIMA
jgi:cell division protein FtsB